MKRRSFIQMLGAVPLLGLTPTLASPKKTSPIIEVVEMYSSKCTGLIEFEEWEKEHGEEARIAAAESGADRECCFNLENYLEKEYFKFSETTLSFCIVEISTKTPRYAHLVPFLKYNNRSEIRSSIAQCAKYSKYKGPVYVICHTQNETKAIIALGEDLEYDLNPHLKELHRFKMKFAPDD